MNKRPNRIALAIIAGDEAEKDLQICIASAAPFIDGVFIAFNGKGDPPQITTTVPVTVESFDWEDDFSVARNQSFDMVPKDEYDFIMWLDADDTLMGGENLRDLLAKIPERAKAVFLRYEYLFDFQNNVPMIEQWRERVMRTNADWRWRYPVHEVCHSRPGAALARREGVWVRHRRQEGERDRDVRGRNRRILVRARKEDPHEPRHMYYLANEIYAEAHSTDEVNADQRENLFRSAIKMYAEFIAVSHWDDDTYMANTNMADCYRAIGEFNRAIDVDMQGIKLHPHWPNAYIGICKACISLSDWEKLRFWATLCIEHSTKPETSQVFETPNAGFLPRLLRGIAHEELGRLTEAQSDYQAALEYAPHEAQVQIRLDAVNEALQRPQEATPSTGNGVTRVRSGGGSEGRRIAFVTRTLFEPWHPKLEAQRGAGGAETCIMKLAPKFAREGWEVHVFGTPGQYEGVDEDGVLWIPCGDFDPSEDFDVVISSRVPEMFDAEINAKKSFLWLHDVNTGPEFLNSAWGDRLSQIDKIVCLSNWHLSHTAKLYGVASDHLTVVPNGVELSKFPEWSRDRKLTRFVWTSSPDRGLDVALTLWPDVKERWPDAQLDIYYGFDAIDRIIAMSDKRGGAALALQQFKAGIMDLLDELGGEGADIYMHGRIPQAQLYQELVNAGVWYYSSYFLETACISALEAQAAGVIPVTTYAGALKENVAVKELMVNAWPNNKTYRRMYIELIDKVVTAQEDQLESWREQGRTFALKHSWDESFGRWKNLIETT